MRRWRRRRSIRADEPLAEEIPAPAGPRASASSSSDPPAKPRRRARRHARQLTDGEAMTRYGQVALAALVDEMRAAPKGSRNQALNKVAFRAGQLVAAGQLAEDVARAELEQAAVDAKLPGREARTTFASGFRAGLKQPARTEERP